MPSKVKHFLNIFFFENNKVQGYKHQLNHLGKEFRIFLFILKLTYIYFIALIILKYKKKT